VTDTFEAAWLDLREPVDHRSRAEALLTPLREWWAGGGRSTVLDLGCGTGSNLRYLAPKLTGPQSWTLIDHDEELLAKVGMPAGAPAADVATRPLRADLAEAIPEVEAADLVTLADACVGRRCGVLFALSYDGSVTWEGAGDPVDRVVLDAVNEHQRRDKGLGPALGPAAGRTAERLFRDRGYETWLEPSPWELGQNDVELVRPLVDGWADAASELRPDVATAVRDWATRRAAAVASGQARLSVGHCDLLALPRSA
jgi:SAM-dependent methyltransferase